jgi:hypothetical protein
VPRSGHTIGFHALVHGGIALAILAATALVADPAYAYTVAGITMPDTFQTDQGVLQLNGVALYSKLGMKVLVGAIWLDHRERDAEKILASDLPRRYVSRFLRHVSAKRVSKELMKGLAANTPEASDEVREQFRVLCSWTRDFEPGDEIAVTYTPGSGSIVAINGVSMGVLTGKGFADAYFACAIGPKPGLGRKFKKRLLGA